VGELRQHSGSGDTIARTEEARVGAGHEAALADRQQAVEVLLLLALDAREQGAIGDTPQNDRSREMHVMPCHVYVSNSVASAALLCISVMAIATASGIPIIAARAEALRIDRSEARDGARVALQHGDTSLGRRCVGIDVPHAHGLI